MNRTELLPFLDSASLAQAVAAAWMRELDAAGSSAAAYCVALSGGRIARRFFAAVAALAQTRKESFARVHFFWADERCVPPNHPESNAALAIDLLLRPLGVAAERIHRIRGEAAPPLAAAEAEADLRRVTLTERGQPVLDVVFLGMGEDGHVASLFPGESAAALNSPAVYRPVLAVKPPPQRITLGYPALQAARQVWVLVSGAGKAGALRASLSNNSTTPLGRVLGRRPHTRIYAEQELLEEKR